MLKPPVWCLVAALLFSSEASAQEISSRDRLFNIQRFSQAMGAGRFITVEPSVPNKHLSFSISYYATYAESPLRLFGKNESKKSWVQALVAHLEGERDEGVRVEIIRALGALGDPAAEDAVYRARKAAATRVEFFTMVRGEDG